MAFEDPQLQVVFDRLMKGRPGLNVLEVGCGSCSHVNMGANPIVTGIDISEKQLDRNQVLTTKSAGTLPPMTSAKASMTSSFAGGF
jgi:cyclopropane fatty-acyl-phospholipid synthase-like methyltransferase